MNGKGAQLFTVILCAAVEAVSKVGYVTEHFDRTGSNILCIDGFARGVP